MADEVYDIFNKNGKKLGTATWTECHVKGLIHKTVHGILFKDSLRSQILLKKRTPDAVQEPNVIEIAVAGHILSKETPDVAMRRELEEEVLGYSDSKKDIIIKKVGKYFNSDIPLNNEIAYLYEVFYKGPFSNDKTISGKPFWIDLKSLVKDMNSNPKRYAQYSINAINEYIKIIDEEKLSK